MTDADRTQFHVTHETTPNETVLAGFSSFGLAGLTAVDYIVDHLGLDRSGHVIADELPTITPFEQGRPRHPTGLFSGPDRDLTVLVGELFVPPTVSGPFSNAIIDWMESDGVEEVAVLSGIPVPHGPDDHRTFYVASDDYRERRLGETTVRPMGTGFLDGVNAGLMERGLESPLGVCVYVTPVHAQAPDVEATIRLVEAVEDVYGFGIDTEPLEEFAAEVQQYYADLAERMERKNVDSPEDRMYM